MRFGWRSLTRGVSRQALPVPTSNLDPEPLHATSRRRWQAAKPTSGLTWGRQLSGDAFIDKLTEHEVLGPDRSVLEIGPGYGRLLSSAIGRGVPFATWHGVDLSRDNVDFLRENFDDPRASFEVADVENVSLGDHFDLVISSLTLKHLYPSFEAALANLVPQLQPNASVAFDLIESTLVDRILRRNHYLVDGATFIRRYQRSEVKEMLAATNLDLITFDEVVMDPEFPRLFVVGRRKPQS